MCVCVYGSGNLFLLLEPLNRSVCCYFACVECRLAKVLTGEEKKRDGFRLHNGLLNIGRSDGSNRLKVSCRPRVGGKSCCDKRRLLAVPCYVFSQ